MSVSYVLSVVFVMTANLFAADVPGYDVSAAMDVYTRTKELPPGVSAEQLLHDVVRQMRRDSDRRLKEENERRAAVVIPECRIDVSSCKGEAGASRQFKQIAALASSVNSSIYDMENPPRSFADVLTVIATTASGRALLDKFLPRFKRGEIKVAELTEEVVRREGTGASMAVYIPDRGGRGGTVYINSKTPLGILAPTTFHEIAHAVDEGLSQSASAFEAVRHDVERLTAELAEHHAKSADEMTYADLTPDERARLTKASATLKKIKDRRKFASERLAYDAEYEFTRELSRRFPCFGPYHEAKAQKTGEAWAERLSDQRLIQMYDIDEGNLK